MEERGEAGLPAEAEPGGIDALVADLATRVRRLLGTEMASVAVIDKSGRYRMTEHDGARTPGYRSLAVSPGAGLGGLVVELQRPVRLTDYTTSGEITGDYLEEVLAEGLRGLACVPVHGPDEITLLLYAGNRCPASVGDRALGRLEGLAAATERSIEALDSDPAAEAVRDERRRIAQDLHDSVAQVLFAIAVHADPHTVEDDPAAALQEIEELATRGRSDLRRTFAELSSAPSARAAAAVVEGLRTESERLAQLAGVELSWAASPDAVAAAQPPVIRALLADTVREALRNTVRHAGGVPVLGTLTQRNDRLVLALQCRTDCSPASPVHLPPGSGLDLLRVRARQVDGDLTLTIVPDGALSLVVVRLVVPAAPAEG